MPLRLTAAFLRRAQVNVQKETAGFALVFFPTSFIVLLIARRHCSILTEEAARDQNRSRGTVVTCGLGDAFWLRSSEVFHQVEFKLHSAAFLAD